MNNRRIYRGWSTGSVIILFILLICLWGMLIAMVGLQYKLLKENQHLRSQVLIQTDRVVQIDKKVKKIEKRNLLKVK